MLKNTLLATMAAVFPGQRILPAGSINAAGTAGGFHKFKLGELDLCIVSDGSLTIAPVQPFFAPYAKSDEVNSLLENNFRSTRSINLGLNILFIQKGARKILVDCGTGTTPSGTSGWLPSALPAAGIPLDSITDIVLTHAHADHIGGLLGDRDQLVFKNASYYMLESEHRFWTAPTQDFSKCTLNNPALLKQTADAARKVIGAISSKLKLLQDGDRLFDCLQLELAAGHTPGHALVKIYSGNERLVHVADLVHSDILMFAHPEWGFGGDTDFQAAASTRQKVLDNMAHSRDTVLAYHLPWPGLGHVRKEQVGFTWVPASFAFPG